MVLPPLKVLLERDAERAKEHQWSEQFAKYARDFVIETHDTLSQRDQRDIDHCFDSSKVSVEDEVNSVKSIINKKSRTYVKYACLAIAGLAFSVICTLWRTPKPV